MPVPAIKRYIDFSLQDFMREVTERKRRGREKETKKCHFFVVTVGPYSRLE
jgi:hypothetical protein